MTRDNQARSRRPRRGRSRSADGRYWIYGRHAVEAVLANPAREIHRLVAVSADTVDMAGHQGEIITRDDLAALLPRDAVHQGIAVQVSALSALDETEACQPPAAAGALVLVLDQLSDPRNVGAILRSAAAFGVQAVVMPDRHAPPESGALAKAASGALETVPLVRVTNLARALDRLADLGYWRYALAAHGGTPLVDAGLSGNVVLVLGAEGSGLRRLTAEHCDGQLTIPIAADAESLNVSAAAAVALFAARQQLG